MNNYISTNKIKHNLIIKHKIIILNKKSIKIINK
jgi:hypothetical protein